MLTLELLIQHLIAWEYGSVPLEACFGSYEIFQIGRSEEAIPVKWSKIFIVGKTDLSWNTNAESDALYTTLSTDRMSSLWAEKGCLVIDNHNTTPGVIVLVYGPPPNLTAFDPTSLFKLLPPNL